MILVAGLTPAWQQILRFAEVKPGGVNRASESHWCASGKAINTALAVENLGGAAHLLSPAGGWTGQAMREELEALSVPTTWIPAETPTRVCTTVLDSAAGVATELVENAPAVGDGVLQAFTREFVKLAEQARFVVLTGSLPAGVPVTFYRDLLGRVRCPAVLDARGPELVASLEYKPRVVKPNREELALTAKRPLPDDAALLAAMRELIERGAGSVVVTNGPGTVLVMEGTQTWRLNPPRLSAVVNPIGSGDCLTAGIALALRQGEPLVSAVRLGIAAAADNAGQLLPARLSPLRIQKLSDEVTEKAQG